MAYELAERSGERSQNNDFTRAQHLHSEAYDSSSSSHNGTSRHDAPNVVSQGKIDFDHVPNIYSQNDNSFVKPEDMPRNANQSFDTSNQKGGNVLEIPSRWDDPAANTNVLELPSTRINGNNDSVNFQLPTANDQGQYISDVINNNMNFSGLAGNDPSNFSPSVIGNGTQATLDLPGNFPLGNMPITIDGNNDVVNIYAMPNTASNTGETLPLAPTDSTAPTPTTTTPIEFTSPTSAATTPADSSSPTSTTTTPTDSTVPTSTTTTPTDSTVPTSTATTPTDSTSPTSISGSSGGTGSLPDAAIAPKEAMPPSLPSSISTPVDIPSGYGSTIASEDPLGQSPSLQQITNFINQAGNIFTPEQKGDLVVNQSDNNQPDAMGNQTFTTIQAAINAAQSGQTIIVDNGTYHENLTMSNMSNVQLVGEAGAKLDVSAGSPGITLSNDQDVTVKGLTIDGPGGGPASADTNGAASQSGADIWMLGGSGYTIESNIIENAHGEGVSSNGGNDVAVIGNQILNSSYGGYDLGSNSLLADNLIQGNDTAGVAQSTNPTVSNMTEGAGKMWETSNDTVENNIVDNNDGPGVWFDTGGTNANSTVTNNYFYDNQGPGLMLEQDGHMVVANNTLWGNATPSAGEFASGWGNAQIFLPQSANLSVVDNSVAAQSGTWGIQVTEENGGLTLQNVTVDNNSVQLANGAYEGWQNNGYSPNAPIGSGISENNNQYIVPSSSYAGFEWDNTNPETLSAFQASTGQDTNSEETGS